MTQPATATTAAPAAETFDPALPLDRIELSKTNPRKHLTEESINEMADSIRMHGIAQPILVRPSPRAEAGWYELVFGERRFRASITAGRTTIPAMIRPLKDEDAIELQIIENVQREDVHELDEANGYKELIDRGLYDVKSLSTKIGKSKEYIYKRLKLAGAVPEVQKLFYSREVTAGHVEQIARLPEVSQRVVLEKGLFEAVRNGESQEDVLVSIRELGSFISEHIHSDLEKAIFDVKDAQLVQGAVACGDCPKRFGNVCADRVCFNQKINACINAKVKAGEWVAATTDYNKQSKTRPYWYYAHERAAGSCPHLKIVVCIDGTERERGQKKLACIQEGCKVHDTRRRPSSSPSQSQAKREQAWKERAQRATHERAYRSALYQALDKQIDRYFAAVKGNPLPIAKVPLAIIASNLLTHLDYELEQEILKELGLKAHGADARDGKIASHVQTLPEKQIAAFVLKTALRSEVFTVDEYSKDITVGADNLHAAAAFYKVDADALRKQVVAKLSTKTKTKKAGK